MRECTKCHETKDDAEFVWDDGLLLGMGTRCKACRERRKNCPDCLRLRAAAGQVYKRRSTKRLLRCDRCTAERLPPGVPLARYPVRRHAVARFAERMRPDLARYNDALFAMFRLMVDAELSDEPQGWYHEVPYAGFESFRRGYLHVTDGAMFSLSDYGSKGVQVATVLTSQHYVTPEPLDPPAPWVQFIHDARDRQYERRDRYRDEIRNRYGHSPKLSS